MSQAVVDPAELRRFAHNLKRFSEDLQMSMTGLARPGATRNTPSSFRSSSRL